MDSKQSRERERETVDSKQSTSTTITVIMFPWLAHGHISPFLELAKKLTSRNFKIYLCSTPVNLNSIKSIVSQKKYSASIELVQLHLPTHTLPAESHTTKCLPPKLMPTLKQAFDSAQQDFSLLLKKLKPDLLIYDCLQPWAPALASSHNIPAVNFITCSATMTAYMQHHFLYRVPEWEFKSIYFRDYDNVDRSHLLNPPQNQFHGDKTHCFDCIERSNDIVLIKSFKEVEGKYIEYFSKLVGKKVVPLPLVQECAYDGEGNEAEEHFIEWLDKKEKSSTVFVSFGTEYYLSDNEMEEIALGLELSGVNFMWVLRFPKGENASVEKALPKGFLERVGDRGMVVEGWASQVKILQHPSIGGFVSHCGWSSVMEGMRYGKPFITIPMHIDQPVNARLVEEVGVGIEVARDGNRRLDRKRVAEVIKKVVVEFDGEGVRKKARELSQVLGICMKGEEDIDVVVEELVKLVLKKKRTNGQSKWF